MSTTLSEKLAFIKEAESQALAQIQSAIDVTNQAIVQEAAGGNGGQIVKPAAPTGYIAMMGDDKQSVVLGWQDPPENADAYQLEGLPTLAADQSRYTVAGLAAGTTYTAPRLRRLGVEDNSDWVTANPPTIEIPPPVIEVPEPQPGEYPGPPQGAKSVKFDDDFTKLSPGDYAVSSGTRTKDLMGLKVGVRLWCEKQYGVEINKTGLIFNTIGNTISGFRFRGLGQKEKLNDNAGGLVGDDSKLLWCEFLNALGVAAAFGFRSNNGVKSGQNVECSHNRFLNCGSAGFGGKGRQALVSFNYFENNNAKVGDTDGAGAGKFSRSQKLTFSDNTIKNSTGTAVWWDIENSEISVLRNTVDGVRILKDQYRQRGITFEWSMLGPFIVQENILKNCAVPIALEETGGPTPDKGGKSGMVQVKGNIFNPVTDRDLKVACEIHLRDYYRDGAKLRGNWTPEKRLANVTISGNKRTDGKPLRLAKSDSGEKFTEKDLTDSMGFVIEDKVATINF